MTDAVLARLHLSVAARRRTLMTKADLSLLQDVVAPPVLDAMRVASQALFRAGVRHAVAGGVAVGANGYPRAKRVVDFLVGNEAFEQHEGGLVTLKAGVPFQVNGVAIDFLSIGSGRRVPRARARRRSWRDPPRRAPRHLKLKSSRLRDQADVVELIKSSLDVDACRRYLATHSPDFVARFDDLVARAENE